MRITRIWFRVNTVNLIDDSNDHLIDDMHCRFWNKFSKPDKHYATDWLKWIEGAIEEFNALMLDLKHPFHTDRPIPHFGAENRTEEGLRNNHRKIHENTREDDLDF